LKTVEGPGELGTRHSSAELVATSGGRQMSETGAPTGIASFLPTDGVCAPGKLDYDPYVRIRCGQNNPIHEQTKDHRNGGAHPVWTSELENEMKVQRHQKDAGVLVVEVWDKDKVGRDDYVGGNHLDIQKYIDMPNEEVTESITLFEKGSPDDGTDTGVLTVKIMWVPGGKDTQKKRKKPLVDANGDPLPVGELVVTALEAHDLRHPDAFIRDLSTYVRPTNILRFS
jgi:hypothetical protein